MLFHNFISKIKSKNIFISCLISCFILVTTNAVAESTNKNVEKSTVNHTSSTVSHGVAKYGELNYPANFKHYKYVNPDAPKGGHLRLAAISSGGFDSLNPFIIKGNSAVGIYKIYDTLTVTADDEPSARYGLIAEKVELAHDRSWIIFHLNPKARFHDGHEITAEDVVFSFNLLLQEGVPLYKFYYADIDKAEALSKRQVKFTFKTTENRELPLIISQLHVLPKHYWENREFNKTSLEFPLGSGPYKVKSLKPGHSITYERSKNYWAKDLPVNKGQYNFDLITYEYFRDSTVAVEGLKGGEYDLRPENVSRNWAKHYNIPLVEKGLIKKEMIPHKDSSGMQGFAFNARRWPFKDPKVREALAYAFDFEWINKQILYSAYTRSNSYFSNSELAATELPSEQELKILEPYKDQLPPEVFTKVYKAPSTDGSGNNRVNLRKAMVLLKEAGWEVKNKKLIDKKTNKQMKFEFLINNADFKRIIQPLKKNLDRLGIESEIRLVDTNQFINRVEKFDFDVIVAAIPQSLSPGNELRNRFSSQSAKEEGSGNFFGLQDPVVDDLIELIITAQTREDLVHRVRALDRVLQWNHLVIPHFHIKFHRVVFWDKFGRPDVIPKYNGNFGLYTWWIDPKKEKRLKAELAK